MTIENSKGIEKIKELYNKIPKGGQKTVFLKEMEKEFGIRAVSLRTNYFSNLWGIPVKKIEPIIVYMEEYNTKNGF